MNMQKGILIMVFAALFAGHGKAEQDKMVYDTYLSVEGVEYTQHVMASHIAKQPKWNPSRATL